MSICAWISVPVFDIAFTLQTFAVFLTLGLLGGKRGSAAILIYLLLGAAGMPVFSGFPYGHTPQNHMLDLRRSVRITAAGQLFFE